MTKVYKRYWDFNEKTDGKLNLCAFDVHFGMIAILSFECFTEISTEKHVNIFFRSKQPPLAYTFIEKN